MRLSSLFKGKLLVMALVSGAFVGGVMAVGMTAAGGPSLVHAAQPIHTGHHAQCPGLSQAQHLAKLFSLSTASTSNDVRALCSLHRGTVIQGQTRVFGYGELKDLLIYAQYLATHDSANASGKLTSDNAGGYLAEALQSCLTPSGLMPLEVCLKTNIPGFQPGLVQPGLDKGKGKSQRPVSTTSTSHH